MKFNILAAFHTIAQLRVYLPYPLITRRSKSGYQLSQLGYAKASLASNQITKSLQK